MGVFETILSRRSYRGRFLDREIPGPDLEAIVTAGLNAPSGKNAQTTEFVVVGDPLVVGKINRMHSMTAVREAKAFIVCLIDKNPAAVYEGFSFQVEDCAAAVENMLLAVTALGYASVWIDGWLRINGRAGEIGRLLNVPERKTVRVLLPVGVPADRIEEKEKKSFEQRVFFNQYPG